MSIIISLFLIPLNDQLIPKARFISRSILKEIGMKRPTAFLEAGTFIKDFENYIIFIYAIEGNKLRNIRIYQPQEGKQTRTVVAEEGEIIPIPEKNIIKLKLINGTSDEPDPRNPENFCKLNFKTYYMTLNSTEVTDSGKLEKKPKEMSLSELEIECEKMKKAGISKDDLGHIFTEIHKKISLSFAPLAFVLIGIPIAIKTRRGERTIGFGISLAIIVIYWVILAGTTACSLKGSIPAWLAMWTPNIVFASFGILMLCFTGDKGA